MGPDVCKESSGEIQHEVIVSHFGIFHEVFDGIVTDPSSPAGSGAVTICMRSSHACYVPQLGRYARILPWYGCVEAFSEVALPSSYRYIPHLLRACLFRQNVGVSSGVPSALFSFRTLLSSGVSSGVPSALHSDQAFSVPTGFTVGQSTFSYMENNFSIHPTSAGINVITPGSANFGFLTKVAP